MRIKNLGLLMSLLLVAAFVVIGCETATTSDSGSDTVSAFSGMTMVVVTHEIGFARGVVNRMMMFDDGNIIEYGPPNQIFDNSQEERTKLFLFQIL